MASRLASSRSLPALRAPPALRALRTRRLATLPSQARVVVVGGGIIGTSTAYHLAKRGWEDVVLLERDRLTSGTTWHAAGLMVTFGSLSATSTEWRKYSKRLYAETLEAETGLSTGFKGCGFIELATDGDRLEEYRRVAAFNRKEGVDVQEISAAEVERLFPLCRVDDVLAGFYVADDGRVNPVDATAALAKGFKNMGGTVVEGVAAEDLITEGRRVAGVATTCGRTIKADYVVNCGGMWARQFAERHGVCVPNQAAEHYYLVTEAMADVDPDWPVVEDPSSHTYIRPEGGGLMVGLFEPEAAAWNVGEIPSDFSFGEIEPDWDRMAPFLEKACGRVPAAGAAGVRTFFCGPESFAPDLAPLIGETPELSGYFVAAGMNSIGILTGPGVGRTVANWVVDGVPDTDVCGVHVDRTKDFQRAPLYRARRVEEALGDVYKCHYPFKAPKSARGALRLPLHERHVAAGATFRAVSGFEAPDWFGAVGASDLGWGEPAFFDAWKAEHAAVRERAGLVDMSFMSKFAVAGRDAERVLQRLSTADVSAGITYTQWLRDSTGTLEADLTVTRLPARWADATGLAPRFGDADTADPFLVVATDTAHRHVEALLRREIRGDEVVAFADVTGGLAQLALQGPRSRDILRAAVSGADDGDVVADLPFRGVATVTVGYCAQVLIARITYVGELGFELFVPAEHAVDVYDVLTAAGADFGLAPAGLKALSGLRLEKGYRDFGHDVDNCDTPYDVGLGFTCDYDKDFNGRAKCLEHRAAPRRRRLVSVALDDPTVFAHHGEVVYRDGAVVGDVRAASYGHAVGGAVGLAMVAPGGGAAATKKWIDGGDWAVDVAGTMVPARATLGPLYDPKGLKIKG